MTLDEALTNVNTALAQVNATLEVHNVLQESMQTITNNIQDNTAKKEEA
jgi:hypothetical protein